MNFVYKVVCFGFFFWNRLTFEHMQSNSTFPPLAGKETPKIKAECLNENKTLKANFENLR